MLLHIFKHHNGGSQISPNNSLKLELQIYFDNSDNKKLINKHTISK